METAQTDAWSVGGLARAAGVTVRTLHHYDSIGLLSPSARSDAGYRVYDRDDLARLQVILEFRTLGFALDDIATLVNGEVDVMAELRRRRTEVTDEIARLRLVLTGIDDAMLERREEQIVTNFEALPEDTQQRLRRLKEKWGHTAQWKADEHAHAARSEADRADGALARAGWAAALRAAVEDGVAPESERAMAIAEELRQSASRYGGYDCTYEIHV